MSTLAERLAELDAIAAAATRHRWYVQDEDFDNIQDMIDTFRSMIVQSPRLRLSAVVADDSTSHGGAVALTGNGPTSAANARHIAAADPTTFRLMLAVVREAERYHELEHGSYHTWRTSLDALRAHLNEGDE